MGRRARVGLIVTAVAVVVIAAVIVVAYKAGQSAGRAAPPPPSPRATVASPTTSDGPIGPGPNGRNDGGIPMGDAIAGGGGRTKGPAGLPLGYTHDQTGAVEAATNYFVWGSSARIADKDAPKMAAAMAGSDEIRRTLLQRWKILLDSKATTANSVSDFDPTRGAYAVRSFTGNAAEIYIFARLSLADDHEQTPETSWSVSSVSVVWVNGDWKLANPLDDKGTGPFDVHVDTPTPEQKAALLHTPPSDVGELPDTAAQNWMEYKNAAR